MRRMLAGSEDRVTPGRISVGHNQHSTTVRMLHLLTDSCDLWQAPWQVELVKWNGLYMQYDIIMQMQMISMPGLPGLCLVNSLSLVVTGPRAVTRATKNLISRLVGGRGGQQALQSLGLNVSLGSFPVWGWSSVESEGNVFILQNWSPCPVPHLLWSWRCW